MITGDSFIFIFPRYPSKKPFLSLLADSEPKNESKFSAAESGNCSWMSKSNVIKFWHFEVRTKTLKVNMPAITKIYGHLSCIELAVWPFSSIKNTISTFDLWNLALPFLVDATVSCIFYGSWFLRKNVRLKIWKWWTICLTLSFGSVANGYYY